MVSAEQRPVASARSLLRTVLGHVVHPLGLAPWMSTFVVALGALGVDANAARQAVTRTAAAGGLEVAERAGRSVRWRLSPLGAQQAAESRERIYSFQPVLPGWDRRWVVLHISVVESDRNRRHLLRRRLEWAGFGSIGAGVWVGPHAGRAGEAQAILAELDLAGEASMFVGSHVLPHDAADLARRAWDLGELARGYDRFVTATRARRPSTPLEEFAAVTEMVHAWRHRPLVDPGLPAELTPPDWPGPQAKWLFDDRLATWQAGAETWFREVDAQR